MWERSYGLMYLTEVDYKELLKDKDFHACKLINSRYKDSIAYWITHYGVIEVVPLKNKCDTCTNYCPMEEEKCK